MSIGGIAAAAFALPGAAGGPLEFAVPTSGCFALDVDMGPRNAFTLTEGDAPTAILLPRTGQHFIGGGGPVRKGSLAG